jgi:hypothetical protein
MPDGKVQRNPLHCVILDHRNYNRLYTKPYDPKNLSLPDCFALDREIATLAPHEESVEPQHDDCSNCPMNKWGSDPKGGKGKACRNTVRLAIAPLDAGPEFDPYIISVSPTGIKSWGALVRTLETAGLLPIQIETEIKFDDNQAYPTLLFTAGQAHDKIELFWALREKAQATLDQPPSGD